MENRTNLLEVAYKHLEKQKKCSFNDIWKHVKKELNISFEQEEKVVGNLYTGMILDPHFVLKSDKLWYPRSQVSLEEIKSQVTAIVQENDSDEEFDLSEEISNDDDTSVLDDEELDEDDDDSIYIAEDSYDDGDQELGIDINKRVLKEEFQS